MNDVQTIISVLFSYYSITANIGNAIPTWNVTSLTKPEETDSKSDIIVASVGRNGIKSHFRRWSNNIIPYVLEKSYDTQDVYKIMNAINQIQINTCIEFVSRTNEKDYVAIQNSNGCQSYIGRKGGRQELNLEAPRCLHSVGTVLHELLHVIGFVHEQSRPDRDNYITVNYKNIMPELNDEFKKMQEYEIDNFSVPYDYGSIMHYGEYDSSANNQKTISPTNHSWIGYLGQTKGLSESDVTKINRMYNCKSK